MQIWTREWTRELTRESPYKEVRGKDAQDISASTMPAFVRFTIGTSIGLGEFQTATMGFG